MTGIQDTAGLFSNLVRILLSGFLGKRFVHTLLLYGLASFVLFCILLVTTYSWSGTYAAENIRVFPISISAVLLFILLAGHLNSKALRHDGIVRIGGFSRWPSMHSFLKRLQRPFFEPSLATTYKRKKRKKRKKGKQYIEHPKRPEEYESERAFYKERKARHKQPQEEMVVTQEQFVEHPKFVFKWPFGGRFLKDTVSVLVNLPVSLFPRYWRAVIDANVVETEKRSLEARAAYARDMAEAHKIMLEAETNHAKGMADAEFKKAIAAMVAKAPNPQVAKLLEAANQSPEEALERLKEVLDQFRALGGVIEFDFPDDES